MTSPWSSGKCFGAGRSRVRLLAGSYQGLINWYCSLLTRRTVCGRAAGNTPRTQTQTEWNESRNCTNSVVALQDHCSYKAPTTNHHKKNYSIRILFETCSTLLYSSRKVNCLPCLPLSSSNKVQCILYKVLWVLKLCQGKTPFTFDLHNISVKHAFPISLHLV